jgi:hypothetical protein
MPRDRITELTRGHSETAYLRPILGSETQLTLEFPKKSTLQFLSIKDFRAPRIEFELLIDHITVVQYL